jgi:lipoyl(octanoyl) transferase
VPCGVQAQNLGVTSLAQLGYILSMAEFDMALRAAFEEVFESDLKSAAQ